MRKVIRIASIVLLLIVIGQIWALAGASSVQAQTSPFMKRPYYGGGSNGLPLSAMFDHWCPRLCGELPCRRNM